MGVSVIALVDCCGSSTDGMDVGTIGPCAATSLDIDRDESEGTESTCRKGLFNAEESSKEFIFTKLAGENCLVGEDESVSK